MKKSINQNQNTIAKQVNIILTISLTLIIFSVVIEANITPDDQLDYQLFLAVKAGKNEKVESLLKRGAGVNYQDNDGITPLYWAAKNGNDPLVVLLLNHNANIRAVSKNGNSIIHAASYVGLAHLVKRCLAAGIDINVKDHWCGWTPMHLAAKAGKIGILRFLLEHKADINNKDNFGLTPLHTSAINGNTEVASLLLENQAKKNDQDQKGRTPLHIAINWKQLMFIQVLLNNGVDVTIRDQHGRSPLQLAAGLGLSTITGLLLDSQASIMDKDNTGRTILHSAAQGGLKELAEHCLDKKIPINSTDQYGWTPLHAAVEASQYKITEYLINRGAVINAPIWQPLTNQANQYPKGSTPLQIAQILKDEKMVTLLKQYLIEK